MNRRLLMLLSVLGVSKLVGQTGLYDKLQTAGSNAAKCPVCKMEVKDVDPLYLMVASKDPMVFIGERMVFPVLVCPKDGVVFVVRP